MDYRIYILMAILTSGLFLVGIFNLFKLDKNSRLMLMLITFVLELIMLLSSFAIEGLA